jgi:hypothetical protein
VADKQVALGAGILRYLCVLPGVSIQEVNLRGNTSTVTVLRWAFGFVTASIIMAGAIYVVRTNPGEFDANFYRLLFVALLPTFVYVLGVHSSRATVVGGASLLGVTLLGWSSIFEQDAMRGVGAALAFFITLIVSTSFALQDRTKRRRP